MSEVSDQGRRELVPASEANKGKHVAVYLQEFVVAHALEEMIRGEEVLLRVRTYVSLSDLISDIADEQICGVISVIDSNIPISDQIRDEERLLPVNKIPRMLPTCVDLNTPVDMDELIEAIRRLQGSLRSDR